MVQTYNRASSTTFTHGRRLRMRNAYLTILGVAAAVLTIVAPCGGGRGARPGRSGNGGQR